MQNTLYIYCEIKDTMNLKLIKTSLDAVVLQWCSSAKTLKLRQI